MARLLRLFHSSEAELVELAVWGLTRLMQVPRRRKTPGTYPYLRNS